MVTALTLTQWMADLEVVDPVETAGLQVFGLRHCLPASLSYLTLDEALAAKVLEVTEVSEGGEVPKLRVANNSDRMVFLMAGEELVGAKQNRILNVSMMVGAASDLDVPVTCVEAGRWRYSSRRFSSSGSSSHYFLKAKMAAQVTSSYRRSGEARSEQGAVWNEVERKLTRMSSRSRTSALRQVYEDYEGKLEKLAGELRAPEGCCGGVFAFSGRVAGVELFDRAATLEKLWPKLLRSYAIDALESQAVKRSAGKALTREVVQDWLRSARGVKTETYRSPGLGEDVRLESGELVGASLLVEHQPVHTELFTSIH